MRNTVKDLKTDLVEVHEALEALQKDPIFRNIGEMEIHHRLNRAIDDITESLNYLGDLEWHVLLVGNLIDGMEAHGPFADANDAGDYAQLEFNDTWITVPIVPIRKRD